MKQTAAAYIRVSTSDQLEYSPDSQLRLIRDYAKTYRLIIPDDYIYMEHGVSGKRADKRPAFQKMIAAAKKKQFETILIYHTSRFARNHEESIVYKSMLKKDCDIDVISITQPPVDRKTDMLTNAIYSVMDEWYSIDLAANVKRGMTEKAMRGGYQCSPPYGYRIPGKKQPPQIVEEEARVVRMIFDLYLNETTSIWRIGKRLSDMGCRTRKGNLFERRTVEYILLNPVYKGVAVWNKRNNNKALNDPSEWIIAAGEHEAIIQPDIFDAVQTVFRKNKRTKNSRPPGTYRHWLAGVFHCGVCGKVMTYHHGHCGTFGCNGYKKGICGQCNSISAKKADSFIRDVLEKIIANIYEITMDRIAWDPNDFELKTASLRDRILRIDKKMQRCKDAFTAGYDTLEEYGQNKKNLSEEKRLVESELQQLKTDEPDASAIASIEEAAKLVYKKLYESKAGTEEKNNMIQSLIYKVVYDKQTGVFQVVFNQQESV